MQGFATLEKKVENHEVGGWGGGGMEYLDRDHGHLAGIISKSTA